MKKISLLLFTLFTLLLLPVILMPYETYKNFFVSVNSIPFSHITKLEYDTATWIKNNVDVGKNPNAYLISDYGTAFILRGITGLNTTADRNPTMSVPEWNNMQEEIHRLFVHRIDNQTYDDINRMREETQSDNIYLVISMRTCWWASQNDSLKIRYLPIPVENTFDNYCSSINKNLHDAKRFQEVFRNMDNVVYLYKKGV